MECKDQIHNFLEEMMMNNVINMTIKVCFLSAICVGNALADMPILVLYPN